MEKKVAKVKQVIFVHGKTKHKFQDGFVYLKTLISVMALLILAGSILICFGTLFKNSAKAVSEVNDIILIRNLQVENAIN